MQSAQFVLHCSTRLLSPALAGAGEESRKVGCDPLSRLPGLQGISGDDVIHLKGALARVSTRYLIGATDRRGGWRLRRQQRVSWSWA